MSEKKYTAQEVAYMVLHKTQTMYNDYLAKKENTAHEIEEGQECSNSEAETPEYLAGDGESGDKKDKKKKDSDSEDDSEDGVSEEEASAMEEVAEEEVQEHNDDLHEGADHEDDSDEVDEAEEEEKKDKFQKSEKRKKKIIGDHEELTGENLHLLPKEDTDFYEKRVKHHSKQGYDEIDSAYNAMDELEAKRKERREAKGKGMKKSESSVAKLKKFIAKKK